MNVLFHMYLSSNNPEILVGNFMGDFVKGPLGDTYSPRIRQGLMLHRKIDSFAQRNPDFQTSRLRLSPYFGLYRGILVDLFYDHFLAIEWHSWSDVPLSDYIVSTRSIIEQHLPIMSHRLKEFVPILFDELLPSYQSVTGIEAALRRMSRRVRRPNPLAEGCDELVRHYLVLEADFANFIIAAQHFSTDFIKNGVDR